MFAVCVCVFSMILRCMTVGDCPKLDNDRQQLSYLANDIIADNTTLRRLSMVNFNFNFN